MCTIAHTPRLPEHCVEYVKVLLWPKENPFGGEETPIDGDDPQHTSWIYEQALLRAQEYSKAMFFLLMLYCSNYYIDVYLLVFYEGCSLS